VVFYVRSIRAGAKCERRFAANRASCLPTMAMVPSPIIFMAGPAPFMVRTSWMLVPALLATSSHVYSASKSGTSSEAPSIQITLCPRLFIISFTYCVSGPFVSNVDNCYYVASWLNPLGTMRFQSGPLDIRNFLIKQWFVAHSDKTGSCTCNIIFLTFSTFT